SPPPPRTRGSRSRSRGWSAGRYRPGSSMRPGRATGSSCAGRSAGSSPCPFPPGGRRRLSPGGPGSRPLLACLRHRPRRAVPARLLFSSRSLADIIYREELERLGSAPGGPGVVHTLTHERPPPGCRGHARLIDAPMLAEVGFPPAAAPKVFVCGPTSMVEAVAEALVELGHEPGRVKTERFGATGGG